MSLKIKKTKMSEEITDKEIEALALEFAIAESYGKVNGDLWKGFVFGFKKAVKLLNQNKDE